MSFVNSLPSERVAVAATLAPASQTAATHDTGFIDIKNFRRVMWIINCGVLGSSATVDAVVRAATGTQGSGTVTTVSAAAIPQLVKATDDGKVAILNINTDSLPATTQSIALRVTVGTAASLVGVVGLGFDAYAEPASDYDGSIVKTITSY